MTRKLNPNMYSIGEVSEITGFSVYTLRSIQRKLTGSLDVTCTPSGKRRYTMECVEKVLALHRLAKENGVSLVGAARIYERKRAHPVERRSLRARILLDAKLSQKIDELKQSIHEVLLDEMASPRNLEAGPAGQVREPNAE